MRINLILILLTASLHLLFMWPGILSPDSLGQYAMAVSGVYSDHHPPLMSFVWHYLDNIIKGSGLIFAMHLAWFYGGLYYLITSINTFKYRLLILLFFLMPQVIIYANMIWKDIGFTFSYLFLAGYFSYLNSKEIELNWKKNYLTIILLLIILFYGTAVKFQAQYCAPILLAWLAYILANYSLNKLFIKNISLLLIIFYLALNNINNFLIPNVQKNHAWQLVKLYDLAAISVATKEDWFPIANKNNNFTMQELYNRFNRKPLDKFSYYMVDDLIFENAIVKGGANSKERKELYITWLKAVIQNPGIYLKHRFINLTSMLLYHPSFKYINKFFNNYYIILLAEFMVYLTMCNLIPAILSLIYFILGIIVIRKNRNNWMGVPLICFNAIGLIMLGVLFFCSMAGTPRYTYIVICMVHASHLFAYLSLKKIKERKFSL